MVGRVAETIGCYISAVYDALILAGIFSLFPSPFCAVLSFMSLLVVCFKGLLCDALYTVNKVAPCLVHI